METNFMKESTVPSVGDVLITNKEGFVLQIVDIKVAKTNLDIDARTDFAMLDLANNSIFQGVTRPEGFAVGTTVAGAQITKIIRASELVLTNQATLNKTVNDAVASYREGDLADIPTSRLVEILKNRDGVKELPSVALNEKATIEYSDTNIVYETVEGVARLFEVTD